MKAELISEVLFRLAQGHYSIEGAEDERRIHVYLAGPTLEDMQQYLKPFLDKLLDIESQVHEELIEGETEYCELIHGQPLEYFWSNWWTFQLLKIMFPEELAGRTPPEHLEPCDYEGLIQRLYQGIRGPHKQEQQDVRSVIEGRARLSMVSIGELEQRLVERHGPAEISDLVCNEFARKLAGRFPKIVSRAERLNTLPVTLRVPQEVQQYLSEATECFLFGQFLACLILCRSAIEFAVKDCLVLHGCGDDLQELKAGNGDSLKKVIDLARDKLPRAFDSALHSADLVRDKANRAVHENVPSIDVCKDMFLQTRFALKGLYTKRDLAKA